MILNERLDEITNILKERKYCTVNELASMLYVTPITVRRDLKVLEKQGLINKCYGGASLASGDNRDVPLIVREASNNKVKSEIARRALRLIPDGSTVFLDASSTVLHLAELLTPEKRLTVVTNGVKTLGILAERQITAFSTGGKLYANSMALAGASAEKCVEELYVDFMFFSAQGINYDGEITDYSESETRLRQAVLKRAKNKYFLCDGSKAGRTYLFKLCNVSELDGVISDSGDFDSVK